MSPRCSNECTDLSTLASRSSAVVDHEAATGVTAARVTVIYRRVHPAVTPARIAHTNKIR